MTNIIQGNCEDYYMSKDAPRVGDCKTLGSVIGWSLFSGGFTCCGWFGAAIGGAVGLSVYLGFTHKAKRLVRLMWILRNVAPQEVCVKLTAGPLFGRVSGDNFVFDHIFLDNLVPWYRDLFKATSNCNAKAYTDPNSGRVVAVQLRPSFLIWR